MLDRASRVNIALGLAPSPTRTASRACFTCGTSSPAKCPSFSQGRQVMVGAGTGRQVITFPQPVGPVPVYHTGHPEPITIPRFIPGLEEVTLRGGLAEALVAKLDFGFHQAGPDADAGRQGPPLALDQLFLPLILKLSGPPRPRLRRTGRCAWH